MRRVGTDLRFRGFREGSARQSLGQDLQGRIWGRSASRHLEKHTIRRYGSACKEEFREALVMPGMKGFRVEGRLCKAGFGGGFASKRLEEPTEDCKVG